MLFDTDPHAQILIGSIGWEDEEDYFFLGTDDDDGRTLIRVQLFDGRDWTQPVNPTRAQGHKIICHIPDTMFRIPKKDTLCYVAVHEGAEHAVAAGVVIACVSRNPSRLAGDRAVLEFPDQHVILRGKSVSIEAENGDFVSAGVPRSGGAHGVTISVNNGTGAVWQEGAVGLYVAEDGATKTILQMTPTTIDTRVTGGAFTQLSGTDFITYGITTKIQGAIYLGMLPIPANGVAYGLTGPANTISTSVFVSP